MAEREFRSLESKRAEAATRSMVRPFLEERSFTVIEDRPERQGQTIVARAPDGSELTMRVRLCWHREAGKRDAARIRTYSAAQLIAKIKDGDWIGSLERKVQRDTENGITHILLVQRDDAVLKYVVLVPLSELVAIWIAQRDISRRLIEEGHFKRRKKNHAENGSSPTLYLQDDRGGQEVADALWSHPGVLNIGDMPSIVTLRPEVGDRDRSTEPDSSDYIPSDIDRRAVSYRQIRERRGQQTFRDSLCSRYGSRCVVTGCGILDVLEAAHIKPYRGVDDNHEDNGLLLRADIHTLFDLDLLGIEPASLIVRLHPSLKNDSHYSSMEGSRLLVASGCPPSAAALRLRYQQFLERTK